MINFNELEGMVVLQHTQKIQKELDTAEQQLLKKTYDDAKSANNPLALDVASLVNMIVTQKRAAFVMVFRQTGNGLRNDKNRNGKFDNNRWKALHNAAISLKLVEVIQPGKGTRPTVYRLIDKDVRKLFIIDEKKQLEQTINFANNQDIIAQAKAEKDHMIGNVICLLTGIQSANKSKIGRTVVRKNERTKVHSLSCVESERENSSFFNSKEYQEKEEALLLATKTMLTTLFETDFGIKPLDDEARYTLKAELSDKLGLWVDSSFIEAWISHIFGSEIKLSGLDESEQMGLRKQYESLVSQDLI